MTTDRMAANGRRTDESTPLLASVSANDAQETQLAGIEPRKGKSPGRQIALDLLRGLLMALMAIDHTSVTMGGYPHGTGVISEGASSVVKQWNETLPYTLRTASHLCAPGFTMLMGVGLAFFTESRLSQGMRPLQFFKHFALRAAAILIVNTVAFFTVTLSMHQLLFVNAVLWTLAINYFLVGMLCILLAFIIEPAMSNALKQLYLSKGRSSSKADTEAAFVTRNVINVLLLAASVITLWSSIWTSPNQGECRSAISTTSWGTPTEHCKLDRYFFFDLIFREVTCPNFHIISAFPPMGWLPFALFGLLYGRVVIHGDFRLSRHMISLNAALSTAFALLFVSTRLLLYGNLTTHCLATPDQAHRRAGSNQYLASFKAFFYVAKYPPSPAFAFFTLSACFFFLAFFAALLSPTLTSSKVSQALKSRFNPLLIFGNQPLFFYGLHLLLLQLAATFVLKSKYAKPLPDWSSAGRGIGLGWPFAIIYAILLCVMYLLCWQYARFKLSRGRESVFRFL